MTRTGYAQLVWQQMRRNRAALCGLAIVVVLAVIALLAEVLASNVPLMVRQQGSWYFPRYQVMPHAPDDGDYRSWRKSAPAEMRVIWALVPYSPTEYDLHATLQAPSARHWLGTDDQGRDVAARLIHGTRISLMIGLVVVGIAAAIGLLCGALAGYYGGVIDLALSRVIEIMYCFPTFFLILTILAFVQPSIYTIMAVIGCTSWTGIARLTRGEFLRLRHSDFVIASEVLGASDRRVMVQHILPNALGPVLVSMTFGVASAILVESSLSFLGFGVPPHEPSWGSILAASRDFLGVAWWLMVFPGTLIFTTITAFNLVGDGLRDAMDPRMR